MAEGPEHLDEREPGERPPTTSPHRRRRVLVACLLVAAVGAAGAVLATRDRGAETDDPPPACEAGIDRLVLGADSVQRDEELNLGFSSLALLRSDETSARWLNDPRQVVTAPTFSPTGDRVAVRWADGEDESGGPTSESIWVIDLADRDARPLTLGPYDRKPEWSPDGSTIAFERGPRLDVPLALAVVPADGGEIETIVDLGEDTWGFDHRWIDDEELVLWQWDGASDETTVRRVTLDGTVEVVGTVDGRVASAFLTASGDELVAERSDPGGVLRTRSAIDLTTGRTRTIEGPAGPIATSPDGERLYLVDEDGVLRRVRDDGDEIVVTGTIDLDIEADPYGGFAVGRCAEIDVLAAPRVDRPLIGTDWRLGPRRLAVAPAPRTAGCEAPDCTPIHLVATDDHQRPTGPVDPCVVATGTLRGEEVDLERTTVANGEACWTAWTEAPPVSLEVDGSVLRVGFASSLYEGRFTLSYGAWFPEGPSGPPSTEVPTADEIARFEATTTTTGPPSAIDCGPLEEFGRTLAGSSVDLEERPASTPAQLAGASTVVARGSLIGGDLILEPPPGSDAALSYEFAVQEVLAGSMPDLGPGDTVPVIITASRDRDDPTGGRPLPPLLGVFSGSGDLLADGAIPAIAFLTTEGGSTPGDLLVASPAGLAVGCDGRPITGLVGTGPAWEGLDLETLAAAIRD